MFKNRLGWSPKTSATATVAASVTLFSVAGAAIWLATSSLNTPSAQPQRPAPSAAKQATPITVAAVAQKPWPVELRLSGPVSAWHEAVVNSRANGLPLVAVMAEPGQRVASGQVLARFDDRQPKADLAQAQANVAQLQASLDQAQANAQRMGALRGSGAVSEEAVLQALTLARTTQAQLMGAQAALEGAQLRLENTLVRAPDAGTITQRNAALGQTFSAGGEMFRLMRQSRLEWRADVSAAEMSRIKPGQSAVVELPEGGTVMAKLRQFAPAVNASNRMAIAQLDLPAHPSIKASMLLQGRLRVSEGMALVVPAQSVVLRDGRSQVFVIESTTGKPVARRVTVQAGRSEGGWIQVQGELKEGAQVAVRGAGFLSDGEAVQVQTLDPAQKPASLSRPLHTPGDAPAKVVLAKVMS